MNHKRPRAASAAANNNPDPYIAQTNYPSKRPRLFAPTASSPDRISALSDELLLRILSFLTLPELLYASQVSHRLGRLALDSHLWKALYYGRFVLPRAMRIPGFRDGGSGVGGTSSGGEKMSHRLHYAGRRALWADGRKGGVVRSHQHQLDGQLQQRKPRTRTPLAQKWEGAEGAQDSEEETESVDWKRQYKIRHNWSRGKCAVEELKLGDSADGRRKMLVKVVEGIAITADPSSGLRAWDLKTKEILAQAPLREEREDKLLTDGDDAAATPTCLTADDQNLERKTLDIAVGFLDGGFGIWRLRTAKCDRKLERQYRHEKSSNGKLIGISYSHPYLITATGLVLISLYTFDGLRVADADHGATESGGRPKKTSATTITSSGWSPPYLLTSLKSHTSTPPLALSIRKAGATTIASIAYTFSTHQGWSIGIQDLHIRSPNTYPTSSAPFKPVPETITTRLAYTTPMRTGNTQRLLRSQPNNPTTRADEDDDDTSEDHDNGISNLVSSRIAVSNSTAASESAAAHGPTTLCYTHPYLLATLPDNTLVLHLCTSSSTSLTISPGIRLWGHTSGISDAEITSRGRAVSVSTRGEEMRVWELEGGGGPGRAASAAPNNRGARSVEIRPNPSSIGGGSGSSSRSSNSSSSNTAETPTWDERRDWVGFDDEMVIVLKERAGGGDSLMVYDFT